MLLKDKVMVVYGAGGAIGGAIARAAAAEGARLYLTGRKEGSVEEVARDIEGADVAAVDALDELAIQDHLDRVVAAEGRVDVSFNAVGIDDDGIVGTPLIDLDAERFLLPVVGYARSYFLTAQQAARRMVPNGSGVIMTVTALPSRAGSVLVGGYGPAHAAKEALTRSLSAELAPHGLRVVGVRPHGIPETESMRDVWRLKGAGSTWEQFQAYLASTTHPKRVMTLPEVADVAVFMASDRASGMTGTTVNLTMGSLDD
ncbi:SDR family NAD(P)-dependent oxidoreductase [Cellulomonas sp. URHE0023]|uniref:SDR family NAD(P)-dependent oxidoreductase n=1 Tax=Cellulomonas sp. URHE0023 TaxID=1380354 RepID=UPI000480C48D|nr:SDR family oxidoreductase [Cellulomonas sp. URHE0023]